MRGYMMPSAEGKRLSGKESYCGGRFEHQNACFAVIRFQGCEHVVRALGTEQRIQDVEGVYQVRLDAARHTIQILYNGDPRAIHRVCTRVCETGLDVVAYRGSADLPGHPDTGSSLAMSGGT